MHVWYASCNVCVLHCAWAFEGSVVKLPFLETCVCIGQF